MKDIPYLLINILMDSDALWADRHDAAIDLSQYNDDRVVKSLLTIARNSKEDETILATCGESLGLIWIQREEINSTEFKSLTSIAQDEAIAVIQNNKPEWIEKYNLL